ncbi:MAG: division/cell wall cluster transcriptional repressor MraZ [Dysgonamonadaceae bacterium]|jgi:MraZ protein|nr:division/cell wall cluster transcriptional repressor MraZ [Dysgonamonadaceae bacterium]
MDNFIGNIDAKVDAKGRVFVPAGFRKILQLTEDKRLILRKDIYEDCLVLYPAPVWDAELTALRSRLKKYGKKARQIYRKFVQDSELLELDTNGRILIPKRYLQMAGINADVRFMGMDQTIEIWSPERLDHPEMDDEAFEQLMNQLDGNE